jgi:hypothetical protein
MAETEESALRDIDGWFMKQPEPAKSALLFLRQHILKQDRNITEAWKYRMPFFCYKGKMCCYLWVHKQYGKPYLGIVEGKAIEHPDLLQEKRSRMKILLVDPQKNIPIRKIDSVLKQMLSFYSYL